MADPIRVITEGILTLNVTTNVSGVRTERRFPKDLTVGDLKGKLELITGAAARSMDLYAHDPDTDAEVCRLTDDGRLLGSYPVDSGMRLHAVDRDSRAAGGGEFDDVSKVEKYVMSEDEYNKKTDTVRSFLIRNKLGKYNEEEMARLNEERKKSEESDLKLVEAMKVGDRCEVEVPGAGGKRRGKVGYLGKTEFQSGFWVGVHYDEPVGKNDGSVKGKRYFQCPDKYGGFVRPGHVKVGDYPEEDIDFSDDDEI